MPSPKKAEPFELLPSLLASFDINDRINHFLLENLSPEVWRAKPPGGKGRAAADIAGHMHNVRVMWLKAVGFPDLPAKFEDAEYSPADVIAALKQSHRRLREVLEHALSSDGRVKNFKPDAASFLAYLISHDSHHRGQISMLAHQLGHALPAKAGFGMWEWNSR
jgi:uncharacterized damage-inducible protein DinB